MNEQDCIYLTIEQIDWLHHLAFSGNRFGGAPTHGIQISGDADGRSTVQLVALMPDDDNAMTIIEASGATPGWER